MLKPLTAFAALVAAAIIVLPTVSQAREFDSADEPNSMTVSYADLNLASKNGQFTLQRRIVSAAKDVCVYEETIDLHFGTLVRTCRSGAIAGAEPAYQAAVAAARRGSVEISAAALIVAVPQ
jgi:UrcA family protein